MHYHESGTTKHEAKLKLKEVGALFHKLPGLLPWVEDLLKYGAVIRGIWYREGRLWYRDRGLKEYRYDTKEGTSGEKPAPEIMVGVEHITKGDSKEDAFGIADKGASGEDGVSFGAGEV